MLAGITPLAVRVAAKASRQHGIVDLGELRVLGAAHSTVKLWASSGHLFRIHEGVYSVVPPSLLSQEGRWLAAVKAAGPAAALSHGPAGQHLGIVSHRQRFALHVSLTDRSRRRIPRIIVHRPRTLAPRDITTRLAIPVTTVTRTVWDLSMVLTARSLRPAFAKAERSGHLDRARLAALAAATPNRRGSDLIRALLAERSIPLEAVRSWLEQLLMMICGENPLPFPAVNVPLLGFEVDFLWEGARFVVEADGSDHLDPLRRDRDNERDFVLGQAGYLVRRYSSTAMDDEANVVSEVLSILSQRAGGASGSIRRP